MKKRVTKIKKERERKKSNKNKLIALILILVSLTIILIVLKNTSLTTNATNEGVCTPDWKCAQFYPEKCSTGEKRIRTCIDLNNCQTLEGKPELEEYCKKNVNIILTNLIWIIPGILISILILIVLSKLIRLIRNNRAKKYLPRPKTENKHYKNDPNYPSEVEQYYGSDQTHNFKDLKKSKRDDVKSEDNKQEKFPDKYWPK